MDVSFSNANSFWEYSFLLVCGFSKSMGIIIVSFSDECTVSLLSRSNVWRVLLVSATGQIGYSADS